MSGIDSTHDPALRSWVESAADHGEFPIQNLPLGIFSRTGEKPRPGVAIGNRVLDLPAITDLLPREIEPTVASDRLNDLLALAPAARTDLRRTLSSLLCDEARRPRVEPHLHDVSQCTLHLPVHIGDSRTSTSAFITQPTLVVSSGPTIRCCRTTSTSRSGTTAAAPRCGHREPKFAGRTARSSPQTHRPASGARVAWTMRWNSGYGSAAATRSESPSASPRHTPISRA